MRMALAVAAALTAAAPVRADYPERPIRLIVAGEAGSSTDTAARLVAPYLQKHLDFHVPVTVENLSGMAGAEAYRALATAPPDGHVLALAVLPDLATLSIQGAANYDARSMTVLGAVGVQPTVVVVPQDSAWRSVDDLIASARGAAAPLRLGVTDHGSAAALSARRLFAAPGVGAVLAAYETEAELRGALAADIISAAAIGRPTALRLSDEIRILSGELGDPQAVLAVAAPAGLPPGIEESLRSTVRRLARDEAFAYAAAARGIMASYVPPGPIAARRDAAAELYGRLWRVDPWVAAGDAPPNTTGSPLAR